MKEKIPGRKEILEELETLSPMLRKLKEEQSTVNLVQDVPQQYFEELPDQLWQKIQVEQRSTEASHVKPKSNLLDSIIQQIQMLFTPQLAIGFSVALLLVLAWFTFLQPNQDQPAFVEQSQIPGIQELSAEDLYEYVMMHIDDYETEDLLKIAGPIPMDMVWPEIEDEVSVEEVIEELLEELGDTDLSDFM